MTVPLRALRRRLVLLVVVYFFAGAASQKLIPGVDEILPFHGWSLFSKVPNEDSRYGVLIHRHRGRTLKPPVPFLRAPEGMVVGNRFTARKLIQRLGRALDRGEEEEVERLRRLLEENHLRGALRYEITFERYDPMEKWRHAKNRERRGLGHLRRGRNR